MDTVSQNYIWEKINFGNYGGAELFHDVIIVNDTSVWGFGIFELPDTTGVLDFILYNAAYWNGKKWIPKQIQFLAFCGQPYTDALEIESAFKAPDDKIIISHDSQFTTLAGDTQGAIICAPLSIRKIWGRGIND